MYSSRVVWSSGGEEDLAVVLLARIFSALLISLLSVPTKPSWQKLADKEEEKVAS